MKKIILIFILAILFSSCSQMRFGHLAKVKNTSVINHKVKKSHDIFSKNIERDSILIESKNSQTEQGFLDKISQNKSGELIVSKAKLKNSKIVQGNIIVPKNFVTKQQIKSKTIERPGRNQNAHNALVYGLLTLLLTVLTYTLIVIFVLSVVNFTITSLGLIPVIILFAVAIYFCAFQALRLGLKGLREINNGEIAYNKWQAIFGIVIGGLFLLALLLNLLRS